MKQLAIEDPREEIRRLEKNILFVLGHVGDRGVCRSCGAAIFWVRSRGGKPMPLNRDGSSHFADCPNAEAHRKS